MTKRKAPSCNNDGVRHKSKTANDVMDSSSKSGRQPSLHRWLQPAKAATFASGSVQSQRSLAISAMDAPQLQSPVTPATGVPQLQFPVTIVPASDLLQHENAHTAAAVKSGSHSVPITSGVLTLRPPLRELSQPVSFQPSTRPFKTSSHDFTVSSPSLRAVFAISRKSSWVFEETISKLRTRNDEIHDFIQAKVHASLHTVQTYSSICSLGCIAEKHSFVLNNVSSNTDMSMSKQSDVPHLRKSLTTLDVEHNANSHLVVLAFCNFDGFTTNVIGLKKLLEMVRRLQVVLVVIKSSQDYTVHPTKDLLLAISELQRSVLFPNMHHELVQKWIDVAMNKETLAEAHRNNRIIMPRNRNLFSLGLDSSIDVDTTNETTDAPSKVVVAASPPAWTIVGDTKEKKRSHRIQVYEPEIIEDKYICVVESCDSQHATLKQLNGHLIDHCQRAGVCVLCPPEDAKLKTIMKIHIDRHLPPTYACTSPGCDKAFTISRALEQHLRTHANEDPTLTDKAFQCTVCGYSAGTKQHLERHKDQHKEDRELKSCPNGCGAMLTEDYVAYHLRAFCPMTKPTEVKCDVCERKFPSLTTLYRHKVTAHMQRDQILTAAQTHRLEDPGNEEEVL